MTQLRLPRPLPTSVAAAIVAQITRGHDAGRSWASVERRIRVILRRHLRQGDPFSMARRGG